MFCNSTTFQIHKSKMCHVIFNLKLVLQYSKLTQNHKASHKMLHTFSYCFNNIIAPR